MPTINGKACVANGRNLLNFKSGVTFGKFYGWPADVVTPLGNRAFFNKVKVTPNNKYTISADWSNAEWLNVYAFTSESDTTAVARYGIFGGLGEGSWRSTFDGGYTCANNMTFTVPANVNYIGVSYSSISKDALSLQALLNGKPKLEQGSTATPWTPAPVDKAFSNGMQVYGRNLYLNSKAIKDAYYRNSSAAKITLEPFDSTTNMWHIVAEQGIGIMIGIYLPDYANGKIPDNSDWSYSADVKGTGNVRMFGIEDSSRNPLVGTIGSEWSRISQTGRVGNSDHKTIVMYFDTNSSPLDVYIKLPKLEIGTTSTPLTPAPEDVM